MTTESKMSDTPLADALIASELITDYWCGYAADIEHRLASQAREIRMRDDYDDRMVAEHERLTIELASLREQLAKVTDRNAALELIGIQNRGLTNKLQQSEADARRMRENLFRWGTAMPVLATMLDKALSFGAGQRARDMQKEISDEIRAIDAALSPHEK